MKIMIRDKPEFPDQPTRLEVADCDVGKLEARGWRCAPIKPAEQKEPPQAQKEPAQPRRTKKQEVASSKKEETLYI